MVKQKRNLLILGGVIAGVIVVALGAFALNSQGGVYKGAIATVDTKLMDTKFVEENLKIETSIEIETKNEPAPPPNPPEEDPELPVIETGGDLPIIVIGVPEDEQSVLEPTEKTSMEPVSPLPTISSTKVLAPQLPSSLVPIISGYNPTSTPYLPASYGTDAVVLTFDVNVGGALYKQSDNIYLHEFYVDYGSCVGDYSLKPQTTPTLWSRDGYVLATDRDIGGDSDGKFAESEFNNPGTRPDGMPIGIPISAGNGFEFSITMEVDSTMCPAGSLAEVVVRDILWSDANNNYYLSDPELENDIADSVLNQFKILFDKVMM